LVLKQGFKNQECQLQWLALVNWKGRLREDESLLALNSYEC